MAKNNRPEIGNPLAGMGLDDIVRGITASETQRVQKVSEEEFVEYGAPARPKKKVQPMRRDLTPFEANLEKYTGISEQGVAIWLPKEVKKQLEMIRINASKNIPLRSLAAAIIMTYISENEDVLENL